MPGTVQMSSQDLLNQIKWSNDASELLTDVEKISDYKHPITKCQLDGLDSHKMNPVLYLVSLPDTLLDRVVSSKKDMLKS